jgi:integrase
MVLYTMVLLAYCAGLRRSELARLDLGDVDFQSGTITIRQTKFYKTRILPLTGSVLAELRAYIDARRARVRRKIRNQVCSGTGTSMIATRRGLSRR